MTVVPAYGRDYTSAKAVKSDWHANMDFIIADIHSGYDGKPINKEDANSWSHKNPAITIMARYAGLRKIVKLQ